MTRIRSEALLRRSVLANWEIRVLALIKHAELSQNVIHAVLRRQVLRTPDWSTFVEHVVQRGASSWSLPSALSSLGLRLIDEVELVLIGYVQHVVEPSSFSLGVASFLALS